MKKTIAGILIVSLLFGASACKEKTGKASETETSASSEVTGSETEVSSSETSDCSIFLGYYLLIICYSFRRTITCITSKLSPFCSLNNF